MARSSLVRKLVVVVLALFAVPTAVATAILVVLYRRGVFEDPFALALTATIGLALLMGYLGGVAFAAGRALVRTIRELQRGTELMATVHPEHRHRVETGDELGALAAEVNRMADQLREARLGLEAEVERATRSLDAERRALAAVLGELDAAVLVVAPDGRIRLSNRAARALFGGRVLLGQDLFELADRGAFARALDAAHDQSGGGAEGCLVCLDGERVVQVGAALLTDGAGTATGFVLSLRDVSRAAADALPPAGLPAGEEPAGARRAAFAGAGTVSGVAAGMPPAERSLQYDFTGLEDLRRTALPTERGLRLDELVFVVLDVETTGLDAEGSDRIVSLAGIRVRDAGAREDEVFDALVDPGRPVPAASARIHGISDAALAGASQMALVLPAFERFAGDAVLVGHDVWFDLGFLSLAARRLGVPPLTASRLVLDIRPLSRAVFGADQGSSLDALADRVGVSVRGRHSALGDALASAHVFARLIPLLKKRGATTLGHALDLSGIPGRRGGPPRVAR